MADFIATTPKSSRRAPTALSPFRFGMFRAVWIGTLSANFGQWVQSVGVGSIQRTSVETYEALDRGAPAVLP